MGCIRGCSSRLRIILDVLEIICFNLIHFAIELSGIHIKGGGGKDGPSVQKYHKGEFIWFGIVNVFGFMAPIVLLLKVFGFQIPKCLLRGYYSIGSISLLLISSVVTLITYFKKTDTNNCTQTASPSTSCTGKAENNFGFELMVLSLTLMNSVFYGYSLVLTWLKEDIVTPFVNDEISAESDTSECQRALFDAMANENDENKQTVTFPFPV